MACRIFRIKMAIIRRAAFLLVLLLLVDSKVYSDFIDTRWSVTGFSGEPWFVNTHEVIGKSQTFDRGYAEGVFFNCNFNGLSSTHNTYNSDEFFAIPEFANFKVYEDDIRLSSSKVFVHRITCEGGGEPLLRQVIYPFVTNETRKSAWYLFEGGVFNLYSP